MELLIISIIIIAAGLFIVRNIVKKIQVQSSCSCSSNCSECSSNCSEYSNIHDKDLF